MDNSEVIPLEDGKGRNNKNRALKNWYLCHKVV